MALGRGLESLIPQKKSENEPRSSTVSRQDSVGQQKKKKDHIFYIESDKISPNPHQPRRDFDEKELISLSSSIKEHGILQPIVVTKEEVEHDHGRRSEYHIVAGERRLRAAKLAGFSQVPVIIRQANDQTKLELALIENVQRQNLNPVEEARAYLKLSEDFSLTQEKIAERVGKSRELIANKLRLLNLPNEVQAILSANGITEGHAKVILSVESPEKQIYLASKAVEKSWSVRELERQLKKENQPSFNVTTSPVNSEIESLTRSIAESLGTDVFIQGNPEKGKLAISFHSREEFERIMKKLTKDSS